MMSAMRIFQQLTNSHRGFRVADKDQAAGAADAAREIIRDL